MRSTPFPLRMVAHAQGDLAFNNPTRLDPETYLHLDFRHAHGGSCTGRFGFSYSAMLAMDRDSAGLFNYDSIR